MDGILGYLQYDRLLDIRRIRGLFKNAQGFKFFCPLNQIGPITLGLLVGDHLP
jgi:hypothetical protein